MEPPKLPTFNQLLENAGMNLADVLVMRHRPYEDALNLIFDTIAIEQPELFNCYQSSHAPRTEAALKKAQYLASFIRREPGTALFIGLFSVDRFEMRSAAEIEARELHQELIKLGMRGDLAKEQPQNMAEFTLSSTSWAEEWKNRLIIKWPGADRAWYQWANRGVFEIAAISETALIQNPIPAWSEICLSWAQLKLLPAKWQEALRQWRGVYLITDTSDGKQYVGSATGVENILQRWLDYAKTGHGGNKLMRGRSPENFQFSILERVSPDARRDEVVLLENNWKTRLFTRWPNGLNDN